MEVERRKSKRISTKVVANCLRSESGDFKGKDTILFTRDLSPDGARVIIRGEDDIGQHVTLILHLPSLFFPLLVVGEIRWMQDISASDCRIPNIKEAGIKFVKIEEPDLGKMREFFASREKRLVFSNF